MVNVRRTFPFALVVTLLAPSAHALSAQYDSTNRLIRATDNGVETDFNYGPLGDLVQRCSGQPGGTKVCTDLFRANDGRLWGESSAGVDTVYAYGPQGVAAQKVGSAMHYVASDTNGNVRALYSVTGQLERSISYDGLGRIRTSSGPAPQRLTYRGESVGPEELQPLGGGDFWWTSMGRRLQRRSGGSLEAPQQFNRYGALPNGIVAGVPVGREIPCSGMMCVSDGAALALGILAPQVSGLMQKTIVDGKDANAFDIAGLALGVGSMPLGFVPGLATGIAADVVTGAGNPDNCFDAATLVQTETGPRAISEIKTGDLVLARDLATGKELLKPVLATIVTKDDAVVALELQTGGRSTERLLTTQEHPFWVDGQGWVPARALVPGSAVLTGAGGTTVKVVSGTLLGDTRTMYNLDVADVDTFFVGESRVLVHNVNAPKLRSLKAYSVDFFQKRKFSNGGTVHSHELLDHGGLGFGPAAEGIASGLRFLRTQNLLLNPTKDSLEMANMAARGQWGDDMLASYKSLQESITQGRVHWHEGRRLPTRSEFARSNPFIPVTARLAARARNRIQALREANPHIDSDEALYRILDNPKERTSLLVPF
jgi:hypothetical protein